MTRLCNIDRLTTSSRGRSTKRWVCTGNKRAFIAVGRVIQPGENLRRSPRSVTRRMAPRSNGIVVCCGFPVVTTRFDGRSLTM